jgi:uncharacterized protein involved in exopolysaccharide biosynthesis
MNTETFDPAKILAEAKEVVAKERKYSDFQDAMRDFYTRDAVHEAAELSSKAALLAIASVRDECEKDVECLKGNINRMEKEWREINHKYAERLEEIERLKADCATMEQSWLKANAKLKSELERKDEALREINNWIATPRKKKSLEEKLALISTKVKALNPTK